MLTQILLFFLPLLLIPTPDTRTAHDDRLAAVMTHFEKSYRSLAIPPLALSYRTNLENIESAAELKQQQAFFEDLQTKLAAIDLRKLTEYQLEYAILECETELNLERIRLSLAMREAARSLTDEGLYHQFEGRAWYGYFVKKWTSDDLTPEAISAYGLEEVTRIKSEMKKLREEVGASRFDAALSSGRFLETDPAAIDRAFLNVQTTVDSHLLRFFPDYPGLPDLRIARGANPQLARVPGYYGNDTFYYNVFDEPFDLRQTDWLFIHEGNPGHHFQVNYEQAVDIPAYRRSHLAYGGFREGWAAYVEDLGREVGLYRSPYTHYAKWEWDLIRSVRLILDVGINYHGWTNEQALAEWQKHIEGQDDIGRREIDRMRCWPAQVLTYKVGTKAIRELRERLEAEQGGDFSLKAFHTRVLSQGSIPVGLIGAFLPPSEP